MIWVIFWEKKMHLIDFLIKAKICGYAAGEDILKQKFDDGSQGFEFSADGYTYTDRYYGFNPFSGTEHVYREKNTLIWKMNYHGQVLPASTDTGKIYAFLREAMQKITPAYPFRGPARLEKNNLLYENIQNGTLDRFYGFETIYEGTLKIYLLHYHGGSMIVKDLP